METQKDVKDFDNFKTMCGDEVVVSGMSGVFPNSDSVLSFSINLYNQVDMVREGSKFFNDPEEREHVGTISDKEKFDAQFFKVGYQQAKVLEPISRKLLEHAYGAIFDSGNCQATLRGKKIGVFIGSSFADFCTTSMYYDITKRSDFIVGGSSKAMLANRISYWVDGKGPSYTMDFSCASSAAALEKAYESIKHGDCDAAVVGSGNNCSHSVLSHNLRMAGLLCVDGKTKCFDKNADGYVRAEAVSLLFLQKAKDAKRIYAEIYHAKGIYELKPDAQFLPVRKSVDMQKFLSDFYSETDIEPEDVEYVEANGAAIYKADENELDAIGKVFANNKTVKIGCVKSNMGNSEAVSGLTAITKLCLAYHTGKIPANLHYNEPHDISAIRNGKLQVLTEHAEFNRGFTALNNFSYTGANYHVVLKGHYKKKNLDKYKCLIPCLILTSGRKESSVVKIFNSLKNKLIDMEKIALLHNIFENDINGHTERGYTILDTTHRGETASVFESVDYYSGVRRPLWFVYSGMGSQWIGMGKDLMRIPTFAKAIERCHKVLAPKGVDIVKIISQPDKTIFDNILNAFVGIGAVQIGLTDILKEMALEPDYIIGHSLGEMACAYHDNAFTAEELILSTYSRGKAIIESNLVKGSMAAVGAGYKTLLNQCPPEIDIACHNSSESSTISGPTEAMKEFVAKLTKQGTFVRAVPSADVAYHSRYLTDAGPALLRRLREVIKHPKLRSKKWISTSVPKEHWDQMGKYSSPEYHTNNLLSPVLFEEMMAMIPSNAVLVEVAPHGLLQAILKRSHPDCTHIPLTSRSCPDGVKFLLDGIGKLYQAGYNPKVSVLYPKVEFPVSTETPLLSHLIEWEHSENWPILMNESSEKNEISSSRDLVLSTHDDDYSYIADHVINGVTTIPEAALLLYVWETLAIKNGKNYKDMSIIFKNIEFHNEVIVKPETTIKLSIVINSGNNQFEISQNNITIVSGIVSGVKNIKFRNKIDSPDDDFDDIRLGCEEIYKILKMRGFSYKGVLKSIHSINIDRNSAFVKWTNDWVPFLDSLIQLNTLTKHYEGISKPKFIRKITISISEHEKTMYYPVNGVECHSVQLDTILRKTRCAGVEIHNITYIDQPTENIIPDVLREKSFFPYFAMGEINIKSALEVNLQIIAENSYSRDINLFQSTELNQSDVLKSVKEIIDCLPNVNIKVKSANLSDNENCKLDLDVNITNIMVLENILEDSKLLLKIHGLISKDDFILTLEKLVPYNKTDITDYFNVLTCMSDGKRTFILLKKLNQMNNIYCIPITTENTFSWLSRVYSELVTTKKIVLVSEKQPYCGLLGFVRKLKSNGHKNIVLMAILDFHAQPFDSNKDFYKGQLEKCMCINVLKKGQWGGYYYTSSAKSTNLRSFTLKCMITGDIKKLAWVEALPCSPKKAMVQVYYSGLSQNDSQQVTNNFKSNHNFFGMDFSGVDMDGDRIMGIISGGAISSTIEADPDLLWPVPNHWSLEDAATVPLPYMQAYYCLFVKGNLQKGQRVLVTGGVGALGQAVISLCLAQNCTVFTSVRDIQKKKMLLQLFPGLNANNICYSDYDSLVTTVLKNTEMKRCDIVINCATGSLREAAMKCVGFLGSFLDLSRDNMFENKNFGMNYLQERTSFIAVDISNIFKPEYAEDKITLQRVVSEGIAKGIVTPLTRVVYSPTMVSRAFRLLTTRNHRGRVLMRLRDPVIMNKGLDVLPRLTYNTQDVVLIVCDETGLGVELADKMIQRGAKKIMLHIKPNLISGYEHNKFISWSKHEVSVKLSSENLHIEQGCASLMKNAMKFGKLKGVFIVQDGKRDDNGEKDEFISVFKKKCSVVLNLDLASRNCIDLSYFTIVAHLTQNASNEYALSLSERVCELRNEMGLPALVIRYESLAEFNDSQSSFNNMQPQSLSTFFSSLEVSLKMKYKNVLTFNLQQEKSIDFYSKIAGILGVQDIEDLKSETTLQDLDLDDTCLEELRSAIKNSYQINKSITNIRRMTIKNLKNMSTNCSKQNIDFETGMTTFYKEVPNEQDYVSQQPIINMPTSLNNYSTNKFDPEGICLIMIPGFEGRCEILKTLAERLKIQAIGAQLGPDMEGDSIPEIAKNIRKLIKTKFHGESKFYILGYSFGVNIALELAAILEKEGNIGVVYCLESSPDALRIHLEAYLGTLTEDKLQDTILNHMYNLMTGENNKKVTLHFEELHTFEEKVEKTLNELKEVISNSKQFMRQVLESAYKRIKLAREYIPEIKLKSELILIKGISHPKADLTEDYNIARYTNKRVKIFNIEASHGLAYQDTRVSNIINKLVDSKLFNNGKIHRAI